MKNVKKYLFVLIIVFTIGFIWSNSLKVADASMEQSNFVKQLILSFFSLFGIDIENTIFIGFIRKFAHFFEYFILGIELTTYKSIYHKQSKKALWFVGFICVFVACIDECIQLIPALERSGELLDVCIDSFGAILAIFVVNGIIKTYNNLKN